MKNLTLFIACAALLSCMSCNTQKRQLKKATAFFLANPNELSRLCAQTYPVKPIRQGKTDTVFAPPDTVYGKADSVPCPASQPGKTVYAKCPPAKTINQKVFIHDTTYVEDTAKIDTLVKHNADTDKNLTKAEDKAASQSKWIWRLIAYSLLTTGFIVWRFLKK